MSLNDEAREFISLNDNDSRSVVAFERAADEGIAEAQYNLGLIYATGQGVVRNYVHAHKWFNLAAVRGSTEARTNRDELARDMTPDEIAAAQRLAREWQHAH